ncbi:RING-H2 finger protein ATL1 [Sesamum alatum]|uniref:RING-type E3 ubiquitin transferase n=1 Tax=Sesamum alatum TaxID=300844 RepID=A0AAE1XPR6_9LAMI|nr:RING-H2 finger protein ATL1 [Sesamum alatum]
MGDAPSPHEPFHPPPSSPRSNITMLYYGLVVVGTAAVVLALYNLIVIKLCTDFTDHRSRQRAGRGRGGATAWRFHNLSIDFVSSFKYKKDESVVEDEGYDSQCAVCLSVFEEGELVRQLPKCNHLFHAQCIDMWLYSHMDCPLCRSPVEPPIAQRRAVPPAVPRQEHSGEGLLGPGNLV